MGKTLQFFTKKGWVRALAAEMRPVGLNTKHRCGEKETSVTDWRKSPVLAPTLSNGFKCAEKSSEKLQMTSSPASSGRRPVGLKHLHGWAYRQQVVLVGVQVGEQLGAGPCGPPAFWEPDGAVPGPVLLAGQTYHPEPRDKNKTTTNVTKFTFRSS